MGVHKDKKTGNYYIRVKHYGKEYEKVIGSDKRMAEIAYAEAKQDIRIAKLQRQDWDGIKKFSKEHRPKTFGEAAKDFMDERLNYKSSSIRSYKSILKKHLSPEFGSTALRFISESQLRKFQVRLSQTLSGKRVNNIMQLLSSICEQEVRAGNLERNPAKAVRPMQEQKPKIEPLSSSELELALANIEVHYRPLFTVLAFTGARPNELTALRWKDIDWVRNVININKGRVRRVESLPKTPSGERHVPMTPQVVTALKELGDRKLKAKVVSKDGYVFTDEKGRPIDEHLDRVWARALKRAGLMHRASYQLRHTFATQCIMNGLSLLYIARILGHSTMDSLFRNYAGWIDAYSKEQEEKLLNSFGQTQNHIQNLQPISIEKLKKGGSKRGGLN